MAYQKTEDEQRLIVAQTAMKAAVELAVAVYTSHSSDDTGMEAIAADARALFDLVYELAAVKGLGDAGLVDWTQGTPNLFQFPTTHSQAQLQDEMHAVPTSFPRDVITGPAPIRQPPGAAPTGVEADWRDLFTNRDDWYDNRSTKTGNQPDFRHKTRTNSRGNNVALWIDGKSTPQWVLDRFVNSF